jgi:hypothetical protein
MNWYKFAANNTITILSYIDGNSIKVLSGSGVEYIYYGIPRDFNKTLASIVKQRGYGAGWQLLKKYENDSYTSRLTS